MSGFNTSTRKDDLSMRLRAQNIKNARDQSKRLEEDNKKMEERLKELKTAMNMEKEERMRQGGGFWGRGQTDTGSLTNYATEVLHTKAEKPPKEGKKKKIKVLQDEPLDVPKRSSQPGTMKYIAQRKLTTGSTPRDKQKGPKCGQCEDRVASLSCVQCAEIYCPGCFAAFHLKGALKQHRSVPLSASRPRVCMSPRQSISGSPRGSQASGSVISHPPRDANGSEASGPPSANTPRNVDTSLLQGDYDESQSAASFQQALMAWRTGEEPKASPSPKTSPRKPIASPVRSPVVAIDESTGTVDQPQLPEIKFKATLSYAERLMLKGHRRTELAETTTPRLGGQSRQSNQSDYSSRGDALYQNTSARPHSQNRSSSSFSVRRNFNNSRDTENFRQESFIDDGERVDFQSLFEAVMLSESPDGKPRSSSSQSSVSITEIKSSTGREAQTVNSSVTYFVDEVTPLESWKAEQKLKSQASSSTFVIDQSQRSGSQNTRVNSGKQTGAITDMYPSLDRDVASPHSSSISAKSPNHELKNSDPSDPNTIPQRRSKSRRQSKDFPSNLFREEDNDLESFQAPDDTEGKPPKTPARPRSSKSRAGMAKNKSDKRPGSRAQSRAASRMNDEGLLTKAPSTALSRIAQMAQSPEYSYTYQSPMEGFFLVGVEGEKPPPTEDRVMTPSKSRTNVTRPKSRVDSAKSVGADKEVIKVSNRLYQMAPRSWRPDSSLGYTVSINEAKAAIPVEEVTMSYTYGNEMTGKGTEMRPSSSQNSFRMPPDDLGLNPSLVFGDEMFTEMAAGAQTPTPRMGSSQRSFTPVQRSSHSGQGDSQIYDTPRNDDAATPTPFHQPRLKSANRRSTDTATPTSSRDIYNSSTTPTPISSRQSARLRASHELKGSADVSNSQIQTKPATPNTKSDSNFSKSRYSSREGTETPKGISSSRPTSQHSRLGQSSQDFQSSKSELSKDMSMSRQKSSQSMKDSGKSISRRGSDITANRRPISSTKMPVPTQDEKSQPSRGYMRPNSSTGGTEPLRRTQPLANTVDPETFEDTVVSDMMQSRVQADNWMDDKADANNFSYDYDDGDEITPRNLRSRQMKMLPKPNKQGGEQWETDVRPFSGLSIDSRTGQSPMEGKSARLAERKVRPPSSRPSSTMSQRSGRESRAIVMEGEDLSCYDDVGVTDEQNKEDKQALDQLEWELASDTGRLTADGQISRMSVMDNDNDRASGSSSASSVRSLGMSVDNDYDVGAKLKEDEKQAERDVDEFSRSRSVTLDEDEVRALH